MSFKYSELSLVLRRESPIICGVLWDFSDRQSQYNTYNNIY